MNRVLLACLLSAPLAAAGPLGQLQTRYDPDPATRLVGPAGPDFVVAVPKGWYADEARHVVRAVLGHDDDTRVIEATDHPPLDRTNVLTLGCIAENPLLFRLYQNHYSRVDLVDPGAHRARVEVICDPYPWSAGKNVIVLGGSDAGAVRSAVTHFTGRLRREGGGCVYPWELYQDGTTATAVPALPATVTFNTFTTYAESWFRSGNDAWAQAAIAVLDRLHGLYARGERSDFTYAEENAVRDVFYLWDLLERHPSLTSDDRLRYADLLYGVLLQGQATSPHTYEWNDLAKGPKLIWNHTGCPLLGIYLGARFFQRHYPETRAFTEDALRRCNRGFTPQMSVWKPQEDAQHYYWLAFDYTLAYAAGEWRLDYVTNGCLRRLADYATVTADNTGRGAGFGDDETNDNHTELLVLDRAFAFDPDPGYLFRLQQITGRAWRNRYHRGVQPAPPARLDGLHVVPMDRTIYDLFRRVDAYSDTPVTATEVPYEQAFDKLSLRDGFDPLHGYLLLDGFSSGKHMHYDANMLVRYADRGRLWLMDDDYLVRQTTDHTGISLLRNGRNTERMPVYAQLVAQGDLGGVKLLRTRLPAYNGTDWTRDLCWRPGRFLVVRDLVQPRQPDELRVVNVLKLYDAGQVRIDGDGTLRSTQPELSSAQPAATLTVQPSAEVSATLSRRRSARTGLPSCRLVETATPARGQPATFTNLLTVGDALHDVRVESRPVADGWLAVRGTLRERTPVPPATQRRPYRLSAPPEAVYPDQTPGLLADGHLPLGADPRAGWVAWHGPSPVVTIDLGATRPVEELGTWLLGGNQWGIKFPRQVRFELAGDDGVFRPVGSYTPAWPETGERHAERASLTLPPTPARQVRVSFDAAPESYVFVGELWATGGPRYVEAPAEPIAALVGSGPLSLPGVQVDADLACLAPDEADLLNARAGRVGETALPAGAKVTVPLARPAGEAVRRAVDQAFATKPAGRFIQPAAPGAAAPAFPCPAADAVQAQAIDGGRGGYVVGYGHAVARLDARGHALWSRELPAPVSAVGAGDLDASGAPQVFVGTTDERLRAFSSDGQPTWEWDVQPKLVGYAGWPGPSEVQQIRVADVNGDGRPELLIGCRNSYAMLLDARRQVLWRYPFVFHGCLDLQVVDFAAGKPDVLAANRYGSVTRLDGRTGRRTASYATELGDVFDVVVPGPRLLSGSSCGRFGLFDAEGQSLWSFDNAGFGANGAALAGDETWLGSDSGLLYELDAQGQERGHQDLGAPITQVLAQREGVLVLTASGALWHVGADHRPEAAGSVAGRPLQALPTADGVAVLTPGGLYLLAA